MSKYLLSYCYIVELLLSALLVILTYILGATDTAVVVHKSWNYIGFYLGSYVVINLAFLGFYISIIYISNGDFSEYLKYKKVDVVYLIAFMFPLVICFAVIALYISVMESNSVVLLYTFLFFMFYSIINIYTMLKNFVEIIKLQNLFNAEIKKYK